MILLGSSEPYNDKYSIIMPPPPPPSKSYLLNIIDSSDEEEEDDHDDTSLSMQQFLEQQQRIRNDSANNDNNDDDNDSKSSPLKRNDTPETVQTEEDPDATEEDTLDAAVSSSPAAVSPTKKRKKKKSKKKKRKSPATPTEASATSTTTPSTSTSPRIRFGTVTVQHYPRCLGTDVVPLDGGWPLGMITTNNDPPSNTNTADDSSASPSPSPQTCTVDEFEERKQAHLRERWNKVVLPTLSSGDSSSNESNNNPKNNTSSKQQNKKAAAVIPSTPPRAPPSRPSFDDYLETRQWDYKASGQKNPLFTLVKEQERMALLLEEVDGIDQILEQRILKLQAKHNKPASSPKQQQQQQQQAHKHNTRTRSRSGSCDSPSSTRRRSSRGSSKTFGKEERYNDIFTEYAVHHVRNELEAIRNQRTQEDARGCTCRKLSVYIPPPGAGKKAAHRRMNAQKVVEELRKRQLLPKQKQTREELELLLLETVQQEPCCRADNNCPCVANGIGCQSDVCKCWYAAHQAKTTSHHNKQRTNNSGTGEITPAVIHERCRNVHGMYSTDMDGIAAHRQAILQCQPVGTPLTSNLMK